MPERDYSHVALTTKLGAKPGAHVTVLLTTSAEELRRRFPQLKQTLDKADALRVAWPKKASKLDTDLTFEECSASGSTQASSTASRSPWTVRGKPSASCTARQTDDECLSGHR